MPEKKSVRIVVAGDYCPIARIKSFRESKREEVRARVQERVSEADLFVVNLECPVTGGGHAIKKLGRALESTGEGIAFLKEIGCDIATLANNHIRDFGDEGVDRTIRELERRGIKTVGAGGLDDEQINPYQTGVLGRKVAILNVAEKEFNAAREGRLGSYSFDLVDVCRAISSLKATSDHIVLVLHGGLEYTHLPSPGSVKVMRFLAEQGVSAIVRHHAHWVQGYEIWKGVPIFYGLGNFLFDWDPPVRDEEWYEGILVELELEPAGDCGYKIHPFKQFDGDEPMRFLVGAERQSFLEKMDDWSAVFRNEEQMRRRWQELVDERRGGYLANLILPVPAVQKVLRRTGVLGRVALPAKTRRVLTNYLRCDAHRELLLSILEGFEKD